MGNNEPAVDQSDFRIRDSYGLSNSYRMLTRAIRELLHQARGRSPRAVCNNFGTARVGM